MKPVINLNTVKFCFLANSELFHYFFQDLEFFGVMRFFFQDSSSKVATKCIRVASSATTQDVLDILIEKFRPDMRMLTLPNYSLYEVHANGGMYAPLYFSFIKSIKCLSFPIFSQKKESSRTRSGR